MDRDDVIYCILLLLSILCGHFTRKIRNAEEKKFIGTFCGISIVLFASGRFMFHILFSYSICSLILLCLSKRYVNNRIYKDPAYFLLRNFNKFLFFKNFTFDLVCLYVPLSAIFSDEYVVRASKCTRTC